MDHIDADPPAFKIFNNQSPSYGTGVAFDAGDYKTIASSHEFGGLDDGTSPSTKEELMTAYLEFLGISLSLQANFYSNITQVCANGTVNFFDQSSGNAISWTWTFEGGNPASSSIQNPIIQYSTPGSYDVSLTVSDGSENSTLTLNNFITVMSIPGIPPLPAGPVNVCANGGNTTYTTAGLTGITSYDWQLEPANSGFVVGSGLNVTVFWVSGYLGEASLKVAGVNGCGTGAYSNSLALTRYLPEVSLEPFEWVCLDWPSFEITGGSPEGGEYSGPGVENGWFNPANAGVGTHTITYTFTDGNSCENFATETILVDPCTGLKETGDLTGINIYPNPTNGLTNIHFNQEIDNAEVKIVNTMSKIVYSETVGKITDKNLRIDLSNQPKGIYFIHIKSDMVDFTAKILFQ
jgi:PKD repeat protein